MATKKKAAVQKKRPAAVKNKTTAPVKPRRMFNINDQRKATSKRGGADYFKFPQGRTTMLVIQQPNNGPWYELRKEAYLPNLNASGSGYVVSPKSFDPNAPCPLHDARQILYSRDDAQSEALLSDYSIVDRFYVNALIQKPDKGWEHRIAQLPKSVFAKIAEAIDLELEESDVDADGNVLDPPIVSPARLRFIRVDKTGQGLGTSYKVHILPTPANNIPASLTKQAEDLLNFMPVTDEDELRKRVCLKLGVTSLQELRDGGDDEEYVEDVPYGGEDGDDEPWDDDATEEASDLYSDEAPDCFGWFRKPNIEMKAKGGCIKCPVNGECRQVSAT